MKILKLFSFYFLLSFSVLWYCTIGFILLLFKPKKDVIFWVAHHWGHFNLKHSQITLELHGQKNLARTPAIFVINHQSMLDIFIISALLPPKTLPIAKKSFGTIPILGWFLRATGTILIDRYNPSKALEGMKQAKGSIEQQGLSIVMAPEGTRTKTGKLQPLKKGAFYLAIQTGLPIIPITIVGAYDLFPISSWIPKRGAVS
ncbi:MAG: 1-acyl-sn-glycerol-3-phosphate acyltransferase, partial [Deltaproteobacteria bacterium]|nr:1-acyl-sn-glycerol-3-phosphate acyltransferase [Deltaproteobacteria bacterium]